MPQHILHHSLKRFANKKQGKRLIGHLVRNELQRFLSKSQLTVAVRNNQVRVSTYDQALIMHIFLHKKNILTHLNEYLRKLGYVMTLTDIRAK